MRIKVEYMNGERAALGLWAMEKPHYFEWEVDEMPDVVRSYVREERYAPSAPIGTTDGWPRRRVIHTWDHMLSDAQLKQLFWAHCHYQHGYIANWEQSKRDNPNLGDNPWPST
jgi:hypothetical protein